jgi:hypothetical protein
LYSENILAMHRPMNVEVIKGWGRGWNFGLSSLA